MLDAVETSLLEFCLSPGLLSDRGKLLVAVSGGGDSVALLYGLKQLKDDGAIDCELFVGHINHNLRGSDSDGDEEFVKSFADELGFQCVTRAVDVKGYAVENKLSIETAARQLRIECLMEMADSLGCDRIATAHHADDNAETMVHRMSRGTGFRGLCGINPKTVFTHNGSSVMFVRPLLYITKKEIIAYCKDRGIQWRHDHTNDEFGYTRNKIRHMVIPYLQEQSNGPLAESLSALSRNSQKLYERIERKIEVLKDELFRQLPSGSISIAGKIMKDQTPIIQAEIIRLALVKVGCGQRDVTRKHYHKTISLLTGPGGKIIELPGGFTAKLELGNIIFSPPSESVDNAPEEEKMEIKIPGTVEFGGYEIKAKIIDAGDCDLGKFISEKTCHIEWFDMDKITGPIYARIRKDGDRFVPIGMAGEKKIGKFLTAGQINYQLRKKIIVFEDNKRIIWVGPVRASDETRVDGSSMRILELEISSSL
ncbi:MAG: tRNA lysidine(34) synthetase TilS [Planctomycetes bacterium]|nr:tRNA lysidine(34) synthetase TilS [Planctomycetota bacterium]